MFMKRQFHDSDAGMIQSTVSHEKTPDDRRFMTVGADLPPNILPTVYADEFNGAVLRHMVCELQTKRAQVIQCEIPVSEDVKQFVYSLREQREFYFGTGTLPEAPPKQDSLSQMRDWFRTEPKPFQYSYFHGPSLSHDLFEHDLERTFDQTLQQSASFQEWRRLLMAPPQAIQEVFPEDTLVRIDEWGGRYVNRRKISMFDMHTHNFYDDIIHNADVRLYDPNEHRAGYYLNLPQAEDGSDFMGSDRRVRHSKGWLISLFTTTYHPQGPSEHDVPTANEELETHYKRSTEIAKIYPVPGFSLA